jgi:iron complex outermembrane receptor protein
MGETRKRFLSMTLIGASLFGGSLVWTVAPAATSSSTDSNLATLQEIVVTAERRPERLRDVAGAVSALTGSQLQAVGAQDMADYLTSMPGVVFNGSTPGNSTVVIRGVSTTAAVSQGQGTTGYFINDVPLTDPGYSIGTPDIDTFDVHQVVVLRGPQGSLFGSSSLGGAVIFQTNMPDLTAWEGHLQGTFDQIDHGGRGGAGKIMLNAPLVSGQLALRGVFVYRDTPGFIDNIGTGQSNSNRTLTRGGRLEALWKPTSGTRISYLFLDQTEDTPDDGYQEPDLAGALKKSTVIPETANFGTKLDSLRLDQDLSFGTLIVMGSYHEKTQYTILDDTASLGFVFPGASSVTLAQPARSAGTTYEARLVSPAGKRFEYVIGLFYDRTHEAIGNIGAGTGVESSIEANYSPLFGPGIGALSAPDNVWLNASLPIHSREAAVYGEMTYHITDDWKIIFGGRGFHESVNSGNSSQGFYDLLTSGQLTSAGSGSQSASGFIPKGSIVWKPSQNFMTYFLVSEGYRLGGPNIIPSTPGAPVPAEYGSDSLVNYELGTRSALLDGRLQLDETVFYIDWTNIQLQLRTPAQLNYVTNAGAAHNYGLESSLALRATDRLSLRTNLTYLSARLAENFNPGGGQAIMPSGTTLPGASKWLASGLLTYQWPAGRLHPRVVLEDRYVSTAPGTYFTGTPEGGYNLFDFRVGIRWKDWAVTAYVNNIADSHGVTFGYTGPLQQYLVEPRNFGLTLDYQF